MNNTMNFEQIYQSQFNVVSEKYPKGSEVFANGKVYKVVDYFGYGEKYGVVGVDREGNEQEILDNDLQPIKYKVCGRCGGSGRFSYNLKDGSTCYGCTGLGKNVLAPVGFPQKIKSVCVVSLEKFGFKEGQEINAEFCGFSKTGGTPKYAVTNNNTKVGNVIMYSTITKHFNVMVVK